MSDLVDDHTDHAVLGACAVGAIFCWTPSVEANHGVLHANPLCMHRNGHWVRIVHSEFAVGLQCLRHSLGAVLFPQGVALFGIVAHRQGGSIAHFDCHGVPNELAA